MPHPNDVAAPDSLTHSAPPAPTLREWLLWLLRQRRRYRIIGDSMHPTLTAGDFVLVAPSAYRHALPAAGDIVAARHPRTGQPIVKRIYFLEDEPDKEARCYLRGDNPDVNASTDSRNFGLISVSQLLGKVTSSYQAV